MSYASKLGLNCDQKISETTEEPEQIIDNQYVVACHKKIFHGVRKASFENWKYHYLDHLLKMKDIIEDELDLVFDEDFFELFTNYVYQNSSKELNIRINE
jgi:hypothetical protein